MVYRAGFCFRNWLLQATRLRRPKILRKLNLRDHIRTFPWISLIIYRIKVSSHSKTKEQLLCHKSHILLESSSEAGRILIPTPCQAPENTSFYRFYVFHSLGRFHGVHTGSEAVPAVELLDALRCPIGDHAEDVSRESTRAQRSMVHGLASTMPSRAAVESFPIPFSSR